MTDERLSYHGNRKKVSRLRREDLPDVALAIVAANRGQCSPQRVFFRGTEVVDFRAPGIFSVVVLASDWDKLLPYIQQGYFSPILVASQPSTGYTRPDVWKSLSLLGVSSPSFYHYVLGILQKEFTDTYPTSML